MGGISRLLVPTVDAVPELHSLCITSLGIGPGLFNAQYMTRMARIALMPPKAMRCRPSETL
jgi:hypothetical protein